MANGFARFRARGLNSGRDSRQIPAMRAALFIASALSITAVTAPASAGTCDEPQAQGLVQALGRLPGSAALRVTKAPDRETLVDTATRKVVLEATCEGLKVPLADELRRPLSPQ